MLGFDPEFSINYHMHQILKGKVKLNTFFDTKNAFDIIAKDGPTQERRLKVEISALRESYANSEPGNLG